MVATVDLGAVVWEASYLPFGGVQTSTGDNANLRFPGQWFQSETALHQNWMRDYDPTLGRYIQADPLGLVDGASVYGYVTQNPGRYTDFMGLYGDTGIDPRTLGDFGGGYGSFWRGLGRCVFGACYNSDGPSQIAELINYIQTHPEYHECLLELLNKYGSENQVRIFGRMLGSGSASLLASGGKPTRNLAGAGQRMSVSASFAFLAAYGDVVSTINRSGNMDPATAAVLALSGQSEFSLDDLPCNCQELLGQ